MSVQYRKTVAGIGEQWVETEITSQGAYDGYGMGLQGEENGDIIRGQPDFAAHMRYCWNNQVKHGYVERAVDWPHSSIHLDIRLGRVGAEWAGDAQACEFGA